ncbi:hypothetical protein QQF64_015924, partial [Cirrhinus molitorella]
MSPIIVALIGRECFRDRICSNSGKTSLASLEKRIINDFYAPQTRVLVSHCFLSLFLPLFQFARGELQKTCSRTTVAPLEGSCQLPCQCRPYPPLPPPPPPPPPPRLLAPT